MKQASGVARQNESKSQEKVGGKIGGSGQVWGVKIWGEKYKNKSKGNKTTGKS
jgi:hypothetical protein